MDDTAGRRVRYSYLGQQIDDLWDTLKEFVKTGDFTIGKPLAEFERRFGKLDEVIARRRANAALYHTQLDPAHVFMAAEREGEFNTYHTFAVQVERRGGLIAHLANKSIETAIHYPVPLRLQPAARCLGYKPGDFPMAEAQTGRILSLPIHQFLSASDIRYVADAVNGFYR